MRKLRLVAVLISTLVVLDARSTICFEQKLAHVRHIRGVVVIDVEGDRCPLAGVKIHLQRGKFQRQTTSDADGYFAFGKLPPGSYALNFNLDGLQGIKGVTVVVAKNPAAEHVVLAQLSLSSFDCGGSVSLATPDEVRHIQRDSACQQ